MSSHSFDLHAAREGMALALRTTVPGLRAFAHVPDKIEPPVAIVSTGPGQFETFEGNASTEMILLLLVSRSDSREAQKRLDAFVSTNSSQSIDLAVTANKTLTYQGTAQASFAQVTKWDQPAKYEVGGTDYFGVQFHVSVFL